MLLYETIIFLSYPQDEEKKPPKNYLTGNDFTIENIEKNKKSFLRQPCGLNYKKAPILIYGCSYAYGYKLKENEHIGYFLSDLAKRPVYNYGISAKGVQHALYIMQHAPKIVPDPEYIIYIFMNDQIRRMYMPCGFTNYFNFFEYKNINNNFILKKDKGLLKYLKNTFLYKSIIRETFCKGRYLKEEEKFKLFKMYLQEMNKETKNRYPNAKFILIIYDRQHDWHIVLTDKHIQEIKNMGIDVIDLSEYFGDKLLQKEYQINDDPHGHPNAKAWQMIAQKLIEIEKM